MNMCTVYYIVCFFKDVLFFFLKVCTLMAGEIGPAETAAFNLVPRLQHPVAIGRNSLAEKDPTKVEGR